MPTCHVSQFSTPGLYLKSMKPSWTSRILFGIIFCLCFCVYVNDYIEQTYISK